MIIVHQMAKVASMAWVEAARLTGAEPEHTHFLAEHNLQHIASILQAPPEENTIVNPLMVRTILRKGRRATASIGTARELGQEIRVITGMRDPVARSVSILSFFADFCGHTSRPLSARDGAKVEAVCTALTDLWRQVLADTPPAGTFDRLMWYLIGSYRTWFNDELQTVFDVDLFSRTPFPLTDGAQRLHGRGVDILVYRAEDLLPQAPARRALLEAAQTFLGAPSITLPEINTAATRRSYPLYTQTRELFRLPPAMLDGIYDLPVVRHFYSAGEILAFKARWQIPSLAARPSDS
jgi:hypothetical protein